jgi:hypothetical protein
VNRALVGTGPRKGFASGRAGVQAGTAHHRHGGPLGANTDCKAEQRQETDQGAAHHGHRAEIEGPKRLVGDELLPAGLPSGIAATIPYPCQRPRFETRLDLRGAERSARSIRQHDTRWPQLEAELIGAGRGGKSRKGQGKCCDLQMPDHAALPVLSPVSALRRASNMARRSRAAPSIACKRSFVSQPCCSRAAIRRSIASGDRRAICCRHRPSRCGSGRGQSPSRSPTLHRRAPEAVRSLHRRGGSTPAWSCQS